VVAIATAPRGAAPPCVVGVEYAPTAAAVAGAYVAENVAAIAAATGAGSVSAAEVRHGDFFALRREDFPGPITLVYDYTFLCALPIERRREWAAQMGALAADGALLVTLQYPMVPYPLGSAEDLTRGPPFQLSHALYYDLLCGGADAAWELVGHGDIPAAVSDPRRAGAEAYAVWRRLPRVAA